MLIKSTLRLVGWAGIAVGAFTLTGCVAPIPLKEQVPKMTYTVSRKIAVAVIDVRPDLTKDKKPPTFIGHAHSLYGIPVNMQVYPWVALESEKKFTLAQEIEQRIAESLQNAGATVVRLDPAAHADAAAALGAAQALGAERLLLIDLDAWYVDINLNWVGTFEMEWGYTVKIYDQGGAELSGFMDAGQDSVKLNGSDSPRNQITAEFRERTEKLLDRGEIRSAL